MERKYKNYKSFNSNYIGGWTFADGDKVFTIKDVHEQEVKSERGGEERICVYFEETEKPMVLNSTNNDTITEVIGSPMFDDWIGKKILIGTEKVRAFGDVWDAVRVRHEKPTPKKKGEPATEAQKERIRALIADGTINEPAFLKYLKIDSLDGISRKDAADAIKAKTGEIVE